MKSINLETWLEQKKRIREEVIRKQELYCHTHSVPNFLASCPICPKCNTEIALVLTEREAEIKHITCCVICNFSLTE